MHNEFDYTRSDIIIDNPQKLCSDNENSKLVLDVVITNASKTPYNKLKIQGEEAEAAAKGKSDKLAFKCTQHGYKFSPISFEIQGQWSKDACLNLLFHKYPLTHMLALNLLLIGFVKFLLHYKLLFLITYVNQFILLIRYYMMHIRMITPLYIHMPMQLTISPTLIFPRCLKYMVHAFRFCPDFLCI